MEELTSKSGKCSYSSVMQLPDPQPMHNGSAVYQIGRTRVHAYIDGPKEIQYKSAKKKNQQCLVNVRFFMANFANTLHKEDPKKEVKMREFAKVLKECYENLIISATLVCTQIDINICILENDGSYKSASFNAATLALVTAGIPITDMLVSCSSGIINEAYLADLMSDEEKFHHKSMLNMAYIPNHKKIAFMDLDCKKLTPEQMNKLIELAVKGCEEIHNAMREVMKTYIENGH